MTDPPGLFEGTAGYYAEHRKPYPDVVIDVLVEDFGLGSATPVLDLGCGTGQLAIPLSRRGVPVHAVDPDPDMLAMGIRAEAGQPAGISWSLGDDASIRRRPPDSLRLFTAAAAFHWMDRDALLAALDGSIEPEGGVAIVAPRDSVWRAGEVDERSWASIARELVVELLGAERRAGSGTYQHPKDRHEVVLARSPFSSVHVRTVEVPHTQTVDDIIGLQLSTSYASPLQLGDKLETFRTELRSRLLAIEPTGRFPSQRVIELLLARRPR